MIDAISEELDKYYPWERQHTRQMLKTSGEHVFRDLQIRQHRCPIAYLLA